MGVWDVLRRRWKMWAAILVVAAIAPLVYATCTYRLDYASCNAQNAADRAALGGLRQLSLALQQPTLGEDQIVADMVRFPARYALDENDQVVGYYLDAKGNRLGLVGSGIPREPHGIEAVVTVRVPTPLTRLFGRLEWTVTRQTRASLDDPLNLDPFHDP